MLATEFAGAIGKRERHDDEITRFDGMNVAPYGFDDADSFVPHHTAGVALFHFLVGPKIAPANAGAGHSNDCVGWLDDVSVRDVFDPHVSSFEHDGCTHNAEIASNIQ